MPLIWGHRGCRGPHNPPENSLAAFQAAIDQGADGIEFDVHLTADRHLVVLHDPSLERMTNGHGKISDHTLAELKQLRLKAPGGALSDQSIPTLEEVLDLVEQFRATHPHDRRARHFAVNVEIKKTAAREEAAHAVSDELGKRIEGGWNMADFSVSSFDWDALRAMRRLRPEVALGALVESRLPPHDVSGKSLARQLAELQDFRPQTVNVTQGSVTPETLRLIRAAGARVVCWPYDEKNPQAMEPAQRRARAAQLGAADVIITDYPQEMRALLGAVRSAGTGRE